MGAPTLQSKNNVPAYPSQAVDVAPNDSAAGNFPNAVAILVKTAGNVVVIPWDSPDGSPATAVTLTAVPAFTMIPFLVRRVNSTGTTASCVAIR